MCRSQGKPPACQMQNEQVESGHLKLKEVLSVDNATALDEELLKDALELAGSEDRGAVINEALRMFVRIRGQEGILDLAGKVHWEGDLDEIKRGRWFDGDC